MGKLFYVMGKSASGKDTIYQELLRIPELRLTSMVLYTTRPRRAKETEGVEYHFVTEEELARLEKEGRVIELREYHTIQGMWKYFTVDDTDLNSRDYLAIGTLVSYEKLKNWYGKERVVPIYIQTEDSIRLERAIRRERKQEKPNYEEVCRRFLADSRDFSEENLEKAGISTRFDNNEELSACLEQTAGFIKGIITKNSIVQ